MKKLLTIYKLIKIFIIDLCNFSLIVAYRRLLYTFKFPDKEIAQKNYENSILNYLNKKYQLSLEDNQYFFQTQKTIQNLKKNIIWVMWWQGINNMPPIVECCWNRLNKITDTKLYHIILITKDNFKEYISLPNHVLKKIGNGITLSHLSDIIRSYLLANYGGFWLDSTIFVSYWPKDFTQLKIYTLSAPGSFPTYISRGNWTGFLFYTSQKSKLFTILYNLFCIYWKEHKKIIDYLLLDYFIVLIRQYDFDIRNYMDNIEHNNNYYKLLLCLNDKYSDEKIKSIIKTSPFFKLSYKYNFIKTTQNGEKTIYSYLLDKYL